MTPSSPFKLWLLSLACLLFSLPGWAEPSDSIRQPSHYSIEIDLGRAYVSGICILAPNEDGLKGSIFNEFGVSAMDFTYTASRDKVKINSLLGKLNKWYIRRMLQGDLRELLHNIARGQYSYHNARRNIYYTFSPITQPTPSDETSE